MIKTVSFTPPRAPRAAKSANARAASSSVPAKSSPVKTQSSQAKTSQNSAQKPATPATLDVAEVRAALQKSAPSAPKTRAAKTSVPDAPAAKAEVASKAQTTQKIGESAAKTDGVKVGGAKADGAKADGAKKSAAKKSADAGAVGDENPAAHADAPAAKVGDAKVKPVAKRSRVPKDLAAQYGGAPAEADDVPRHVVEASAPRKRLTRAKKEARSQLLRADDEVLQRLQQANVIEAKKPATRGRGWEFECGCCGRVTRFGTPAAICECGAIAVRE